MKNKIRNHKPKKPLIIRVERKTWVLNPVERIKQNKKGKGSYKRQKRVSDHDG